VTLLKKPNPSPRTGREALSCGAPTERLQIFLPKLSQSEKREGISRRVPENKNATVVVAFSMLSLVAKLELAFLTRFFQGSHQAAFAACGIAGMDDVLAGSLVQRFVRLGSGRFRFFQFASGKQLTCFLHESAC
jgi:hypothetical protein